MSVIRFPLERLFFGNEHWRSNRAANEIEIYCELLETLQDKIEALETRGKDEEVALSHVQAFLSSYAFEIAIKSLWALDNRPKPVPHDHNLSKIFDGLNEETVKELNHLQLYRPELKSLPKPFVSNRYSMEHGSWDYTVYQPHFLRSLILLIRKKMEESREPLFKPPKASPN